MPDGTPRKTAAGRTPPWPPRTSLRLAGLFALILATGGLFGCSSVPDGYYKIREGDTLSEIAVKQRVSLSALARWNGISPPYTIYAGRLLRVEPPDGAPVVITGNRSRGSKSRASGGSGKTSRAPAVTASRPSAPEPVAPGSRRAASGVAWEWPLNGSLKQGFREGDRTRQGVRIACRAGEAVRATAPGSVVYSGSGLKGYGNLIILRHNDKYLSAYGFNRRLFAREGDSIKRGQTVAECGQGPGGSHLLHFEVRRDGVAVDPVLYLPPR
jgi:lipoprotein NlpD